MLNWRALPVRLAATLAAGLPPDSRSMMVLHGQKLTLAQTLQAAELDTLQAICWRIGRLAYVDEKPPTSILNTLLGKTEAESEDSPVQYFDSPEEFEAAMRAAEGCEPDGKRH